MAVNKELTEKASSQEKVSEVRLQQGLLNKMVEHLESGAKTNKEILESITFIKRYYYWRSIANILKIAILVLVLVLGIVNWRNLSSIANDFSFNIQEKIIDLVKSGLAEKIHIK